MDPLAPAPAPATSHNPFDPTQPVPPFAGRAEQFARLHQHLTSAAVPHAMTLLGRRRSGRTAFIGAARSRFNEAYVWATPDLEAVATHDGWLHALYQSGKDAASARGLSVHRLPRWPDEKPPAEQRIWLTEVGLPELYQLIRPHRRLVFLIDGAEPLASAISGGSLPADMGEWMAGLIGAQLGFVLTAHVDNDAALTALSPLFQPEAVLRLGTLTEGDVAELLALGRGDADATLAAQIHALTGGLPELVLKSAAAIHDLSRGEGYSPAHLKQAHPALAAASVPYFRGVWENLSADEQAVLTALAYLHFARPDQPLTAEDVEAWLANSDYPLDLTAIFAVLRRLEFVEIVRGSHRQVAVRASLFESYIRDTVKPEALRRSGASAPAAAIDPTLLRYGIAVLIVVLAVMIAFAVFNQPAPAANGTPVPTLILEN